MTSAGAMKCTNCGGQLPLPPPGERFLRCHYCGTSLQVNEPVAPPRVSQLDAPRIVVVQPGSVSVPGRGFRALMILIPVGIVLFSSGIGVFTRMMAGVAGVSGPGAGGVTPFGENLQWSGSAPLAARLNADDIEDFVGLYRLLEGDEQNVFVGGFDGKSLDRVWAAGPFGNLSESINQTLVATVKNKVVVTDFRSVAHILDLGTGKETAKIALSDRAKALCPSTEGKPEVWLELADEQNVLLDVAAGTSRKAPRPAACVSARDASHVHCELGSFTRTHAACHEDSSIKAPGVRIDKILSEGEVAVALGTKSPGTAIATALGVDLRSKKIKWQHPIARVDPATVQAGLDMADLGTGRLVTQYQLTSGLWRLTALDGSTGNPLWDVEIPRSNHGSKASDITLTASRVYLPHWTWLDVFDAKTGALIGTVGKW